MEHTKQSFTFSALIAAVLLGIIIGSLLLYTLNFQLSYTMKIAGEVPSTSYENEERQEVIRNEKTGRIENIVIHRKAREL